MNKLLNEVEQNIVTCQWRVDQLICEILTNHVIFAITEFSNCFINECLRDGWFHLRMSRILFAAKQSWTTLRMSNEQVYSVISFSVV